jgi:parvulin-like peptidyl-prolyl isomerase
MNERRNVVTRSAFVYGILLLAFMFGAAATGETALSAQTPETGGAASPAPDLVVVRVSGEPITERQILDTINEMAKQENLTLEQSQQRNSLFFDRAVENLITLSLMRARMREMNIAVDDAVVEAQLRQVSQSFSSPEAFQKALANQGLTEAGLRNSIVENIRMQKVADEASKDAAPVTEAEMEKYYSDNPDKFAVPERARVAHILLQIPQGATTAQKEEARKKLESVRVEIAAEILTFEEAAAKYSQDADTAAKGGDMGFLTRGNMPKSFADVLFNTKPGTVSPALESQAGYHILKALEIKPAGQAELEEIRSALRQSLEQNAKQSARQKFIEELKSKAIIEYFMKSEEFDKRQQ